MSHYLRRAIEAADNIDVRLGTQVVGAAATATSSASLCASPARAVVRASTPPRCS